MYTPWLIPEGHEYQYDLGWLVRKLLSFETELNTAIDLKTIHYADPLQWDITTQYSPNTVVVDPKTGTAYMSKVPIPAGVQLTNTDYWVVVFNYQRIYDKIMSGVAFNDKDNLEASKDIQKYDFVWFGGNLYQAQRDILQGSKYVPDVNIVPATIADALAAYYGDTRTAAVNSDTVTVAETQTIAAKNRVINVTGDQTITAGDIAETSANRTITAGDIAETSANRTIKTTADYHTDIDGNFSEHVDGTARKMYGNSLDIGVAGPYTAEYQVGTTETYAGERNVSVQRMNITSAEKTLPIVFPDKTVDLYKLDQSVAVNVMDFGVVGDGIANDTNGIQSAIDYCTTTNQTLFIPEKWYLIDEITISCPIIGNAKFLSKSAKTAITLPKTAGHITVSFKYLTSNTDIHMATPSNDDSVGLKIMGRDYRIFCDTISGFGSGVKMESTTDTGIYLNKLYINHIFNSNNLLHIYTSNKGWCNGNAIYGTEFQYNLNNTYWNTITKTCILEEYGTGSQGVDQLNFYNCFFERQIDDPVHTFTMLRGNSINNSNFIGCRFELHGKNHVMVDLTANATFRPYNIKFFPWTNQLSNRVKLHGWFNRPANDIVTTNAPEKTFVWNVNRTIKYLTDGSKAYFQKFTTREFSQTDQFFVNLKEAYVPKFSTPLTLYITNIKKLEDVKIYVDSGSISVTLWNNDTKITDSPSIVGNLSYDGKKYIMNVPRNILTFSHNNDTITMVCVHITDTCGYIECACNSNTAVIRSYNGNVENMINSNTAPTNISAQNNVAAGEIVKYKDQKYQYVVADTNKWKII